MKTYRINYDDPAKFSLENKKDTKQKSKLNILLAFLLVTSTGFKPVTF